MKISAPLARTGCLTALLLALQLSGFRAYAADTTATDTAADTGPTPKQEPLAESPQASPAREGSPARVSGPSRRG